MTRNFAFCVLLIVSWMCMPALAETINFSNGDADYDDTPNVVLAGPTPVNMQTTGKFRDVFWWGTATGVGDFDFINSNNNLISNGGSPSRAVLDGDDPALNFTGVRIPNGGKSFLTVYDTTPLDATEKNLFDAKVPGGITISADVLFAPGNHAADGGVVALYSEGQDALALLAHNGGGNNADVPKLSLIYQSPGAGNVNGVVLASQSLNPDGGSGGLPILGDTNPGLSDSQRDGSTSGDHWYRVIMNVTVSSSDAGDTYAVTGSIWNHEFPWDPNSDLTTQIGTDLVVAGNLLSDPSPGNGADLARVLTNPGQIGLMASVTGGFGDAINFTGGGTPANPLVDNVGVSITNFTFPTTIPEPSSAVLAMLATAMLGVVRRRR